MEQFVHTLAHGGMAVLNFLNNVPAEYYLVIIGALPLSIVIAFVKAFIKRRWDKQPSETKMFLTNIGGIAVMAVVAYLNSTPETDPYKAIGSLVFGATLVQQPFFFKIVKPLVALTIENWENGNKLSEELKSAAVPTEGLPIE